MDPLGELKEMAESKGGSMTVHELQNEQGEVVHSFATMSLPLRKDHWIYQKGDDGFGAAPPMPFKMGSGERAILIISPESLDPLDAGPPAAKGMTLTREGFAAAIRAAGKYAVRGATMHGAEMDFDPDALLQNLIVGFLGYWTANGLSGDDCENPTTSWTPPPDRPRRPGMSVHAALPPQD